MSDEMVYEALGEEVTNSFRSCDLIDWAVSSIAICRLRVSGQAERDGLEVTSENFTIWANGWDVRIGVKATARSRGQS